MKAIQVRLPESIHRRAKQLAGEEGVSLNQFILTSVSNEVVRQETRDFFRAAAAKFDPAAFAEALGAVPDGAPVKSDRLR
jgi:hypothetical protein